MENGQDASGIAQTPNTDTAIETLDGETVLIAGGGPVGLILATVLAKYGVKSIVLERNESTTRYESSCISLASLNEL